MNMSNKYEREIEEILRQAGDLPSPKSQTKPTRRVWRGGSHWARRVVEDLRRVCTPGNLVKAAIILLVGSFLLRPVIPALAMYASSAGLVLLVVGVAAFVLTDRPAPEPKWRGRALNLSQRQPHWWQILYYRWQSLWRRPRR